MEQNFFEYSLLALWSLAVGAFLCAVYDVFRVFRLEKRQNAVLLFFADVAFSLICSFSMLVLFFNLSYGKMRLYAFCCALLGFLVWRFTVSRIYISLIKHIIGILKKLFGYIKQRLCSAAFNVGRYLKTFCYCRAEVRKFNKGLYFKKRKEVNYVTKEDCTGQPGH